MRKERLKQSVRSFNDALESGDAAKMQEEFKKATKTVCRAGDNGILHKNAVNRKKSQLAKALNKAAAAKKA